MISTTTNAEFEPVLPLVSKPMPRQHDLHETCQMLLRRIGWPQARGSEAIRTLGFTSCYAGEGVSTVASHVAFSAAMTGPQRVVLVDLNFASPSVHKNLDVEQSPGVRDILSEKLDIEDALQCTSLTQFMALPAGTPSKSPTVYHPQALRNMLQGLSECFDLVVLDLPCCNKSNGTLTIAGQLDGVCLVVEAERVRAEVALRTKELLSRGGANLLGAVMNKQPRHVPEWLYRTL